MTELLDAILQISYSLSDSCDQISEIVFSQPLIKKEGEVIALHFYPKKSKHPIQQFILPPFLSRERKSRTSQLKTLLAQLLSQETLFDYFLTSKERRVFFQKAVEEVAKEMGISDFSWPKEEDASLIAKKLTTLNSKKKSLLEDKKEFHLQLIAFPKEERRHWLYLLLSKIKRPSFQSHITIQSGDLATDLTLQTDFGKCHLRKIESDGKLQVDLEQETITPSIATQESLNPESTGPMNLRIVRSSIASTPSATLGIYSGTLLSDSHVLSSLLFLLHKEGKRDFYLFDRQLAHSAEEKIILFTSLFSWHELENIIEEKRAIESVNGKILRYQNQEGKEEWIRLKLLYHDIPFDHQPHPLVKPGEMNATIHDISNESRILLFATLVKKKNYPLLELLELARKIEAAKQNDFFAEKKSVLEAIDEFRNKKESILSHFATLEPDNAVVTAIAFLFSEKASSTDVYIATSNIVRELKISHHINGSLGKERTEEAVALDKASLLFSTLNRLPYLPEGATESEKELFQLFYHLYLFGEEGRLNLGLSMGSTREEKEY